MMLMRLAGLRVELDCHDGAVAGALADAARDFLAAGGHVTLAEWSMLEPEERVALQLAQKVRDTSMACMVGMACSGPLERAKMWDDLDGGAGSAQLRAERAVERASNGS